MPRFFFDVHDGKGCNRDERGIELPNVTLVWEIAIPMLDGIAKQNYGESPSRDISVVVRDVCDVVVYRSDFVRR